MVAAFTRRTALAGVLASSVALSAGTALARQDGDDDAGLQAAIAKSNAYTALMNRTLRAVESWGRYASWVDMRRGPTGRERYISYGLYSLYDVRGEIEKAEQALTREPALPDLDDAIRRYIQSYQALAPLITRAERYYERKDYQDDRMAEGRDLHRQMVPAAEAFLKDRAEVDQSMRAFRADLNGRELAAIERREGRSGRWHVRNVMISARAVMDTMPDNDKPVVNLQAFDAALQRYSAAVRELDGIRESDPRSVSMIDSQASSWLGKLREFRQKIGRSRGDARRGAGHDAMWIVNQYNMMVSMAETQLRMRR